MKLKIQLIFASEKEIWIIKIMIEQIIAVLATGAYSLIATLIILKILDVIPGLGLQVAEQTESAGLDVSEQGERGYVQDVAD